jgi:hypothetical protein
MRGAPLCGPCIAAKSALSLPELDACLLRLRATVTPVMTLGPCAACGHDTLRYHIA